MGSFIVCDRLFKATLPLQEKKDVGLSIHVTTYLHQLNKIQQLFINNEKKYPIAKKILISQIVLLVFESHSRCYLICENGMFSSFICLAENDIIFLLTLYC